MSFRKYENGRFVAESPEVRFWRYVEKTESCWNWVGKGFYPGNYGSFYFKGKTRRAHRVSWILHNGEIPKGMCVCHHCDNPKCVRPDHLFLGTYKDNIWDAIKKGRSGTYKKSTHCKKGHELSKENSHIYHYKGNNIWKPKITRICKICKDARNKARSKGLKKNVFS